MQSTEEQLVEIENSNYNSRMYKAMKQLKLRNIHTKTSPSYKKQDLTKFYQENSPKNLLPLNLDWKTHQKPKLKSTSQTKK